ncbi:MAG: hypothetical protein IKO06_01690 [Alphaproteobacteria bacterium]|nr:hypothetical protein [Alphaproteobacteria bacterium]
MKISTIDKIFKYFYVSFLTTFVCYIAYFTAVLLISPKNDLHNRGFIKCTKELVIGLGECESGQISCVFGSFYSDAKCNSDVIFAGFANWVKGKQPTPWANYIFEPAWQDESENPYLSDPAKDMENMAIDREYMLKKEQELENIKNRSLKVDENVIISDPEATDEPVTAPESEAQTESDFEQNIDDESDIGAIGNGDKTAKKIEPLPEKKIKSDSEKIAERAKNEVLKKEKNKND